MSRRDAHEAFYSHKSHEHKGDYKRGCPTCEELWQRLLRASREEAGLPND